MESKFLESKDINMHSKEAVYRKVGNMCKFYLAELKPRIHKKLSIVNLSYLILKVGNKF